MPSTYDSIATTTLQSAATSVTMGSIPSTYTDLIVVITPVAASGASNGMRMVVNSDTGANYSSTYMYGRNTTTYGGNRQSTTGYFDLGWYSAAPATKNLGVWTVHLQNYATTGVYRTFLSRNDIQGEASEQSIHSWRNTANAVSSLTFQTSGGVSNQLQSGTTITIYGIKAA